ncbi:zinc finger, CCHC-type containing protein, partial [Tanacetum coccineum]
KCRHSLTETRKIDDVENDLKIRNVTPYTPQQNGVAERKNRTLKEMVKSMLSYSGLSEGFWGEAMLTACYILNRTPNKNSKQTPYEIWTNKVPNLTYLRVWGCRAVVRLNEPKMKNLGEKGIDCIFIGYDEHSKCYRFYVIEPNDYVSVNSIIESRDVIFDEERFKSIPRPRGMIQPSSSKIAEDEVEGTDDVPSPSVPRKSTRTRKAKSFGNLTWLKEQEIILYLHMNIVSLLRRIQGP